MGMSSFSEQENIVIFRDIHHLLLEINLQCGFLKSALETMEKAIRTKHFSRMKKQQYLSHYEKIKVLRAPLCNAPLFRRKGHMNFH